MPTELSGTYTIKELIQKTFTSQKFKNRFDYMDRDSVRVIQIKKIHYFNSKDRNSAPIVKIQIVTRSTPRYVPYIKKLKNGKVRQKGIKHQYDITFECDRMSINTKNWAVMVGSGKQWIKNPPQSKIRSIYRENLSKWSKEKKEEHRKKKGLHEDVGDWNSQERGINADWIFSFSYCFSYYGHRLGREYGIARSTPPSEKNPSLEMAAPKHLLAFFKELMEAGILKDD